MKLQLKKTTTVKNIASKVFEVLAAASVIVLGTGSAAEAACYQTQTGWSYEIVSYKNTTQTQYVQVGQVVPVAHTVWQNVVTGTYTYYTTEYGYELRPHPVYSQAWTHYNVWSNGMVTSCVDYSLPLNCGSHGAGWKSHYSEGFHYQSGTTYSWDWVPRQVANTGYTYSYQPVTTYTYEIQWVSVAKTVNVMVPVYDYVPVYSTVCVPDVPPTPPTYVLSYDLNGGMGTPTAVSATSGTAVSLANSGFSRTNYNFVAWHVGSATGNSYAAGATFTLNANTTMYAEWKPITYTVTYAANGGTGSIPAYTGNSGTTMTLAGATSGITRKDYTLTGWTDSSGSTYGLDTAYVLRSDKSLKAVWTADAGPVRPS